MELAAIKQDDIHGAHVQGLTSVHAKVAFRFDCFY